MSQHTPSVFSRYRNLRHTGDDTPTACVGDLVRDDAQIVGEDTPLAEIRKILIEHRVPAVAVADPAGAITGLVTRTDVLRARDADATAADAMSGFVFALPAHAPVAQAAALMACEEVGQILVRDDRGALVGMVSAVDVARYLAIDRGFLRR